MGWCKDPQALIVAYQDCALSSTGKFASGNTGIERLAGGHVGGEKGCFWQGRAEWGWIRHRRGKEWWSRPPHILVLCWASWICTSYIADEDPRNPIGMDGTSFEIIYPLTLESSRLLLNCTGCSTSHMAWLH